MIDESEIASCRKVAQLLGQRYYEGSACNHGHGNVRYTGNSACVVCVENYGRSYKADHAAAEKDRRRTYKAENADRVKEQKRLAYARHPQRLVELERRIDKVLRAASERARLNAEFQAQREEKAFKLFLFGELDNDLRIARHRIAWRRNRSNRRARMRNAEGRYSVSDEIELAKAKKLGCVYCGSLQRLHLDHKIPLSRGGTNYRFNLQWLCQPHNQAKHTKTDEEFRLLIGLPKLFEDLL